jgi:hypothetical protein
VVASKLANVDLASFMAKHASPSKRAPPPSPNIHTQALATNAKFFRGLARGRHDNQQKTFVFSATITASHFTCCYVECRFTESRGAFIKAADKAFELKKI